MKYLVIAGALFATVYGTKVNTQGFPQGGPSPFCCKPEHKVEQHNCGCHKSVNYDYTCKAEHLEDCLENDIALYGPNVVLVNLDNRCQVEKFEHNGIFLQTGDILFVTGRENKCAGQEW